MKTTTTFKELRKCSACTARYRHLAKKLGGVRKYGHDTPISILQILKHNGPIDTWWVAGVVVSPGWNALYAQCVSAKVEAYYTHMPSGIGMATSAERRRYSDALNEIILDFLKERTSKKLHGSVVEEKKPEGK